MSLGYEIGTLGKEFIDLRAKLKFEYNRNLITFKFPFASLNLNVDNKQIVAVKYIQYFDPERNVPLRIEEYDTNRNKIIQHEPNRTYFGRETSISKSYDLCGKITKIELKTIVDNFKGLEKVQEDIFDNFSHRVYMLYSYIPNTKEDISENPVLRFEKVYEDNCISLILNNDKFENVINCPYGPNISERMEIIRETLLQPNNLYIPRSQ